MSKEADLAVSPALTIRGSEFEILTSRSGGPGGQNVQKTDSRVTLRWDVAASPSLSEAQRALLLRKLESRLVGEGILAVHVETERSQKRNREIARERLAAIVLAALHQDKPRIKTKAHAGAKARRIDEKKHQGALKQSRTQRDFD